MTLHARTAAVDETRALAAAVSEVVQPGDVVVLAGDLGAGKTAFVQGLCRGLGIEERVTSPTFTLVHVYDGGRLPVHHLDVYRLDQLSEALDLGLAEMLDAGGVVLVEWGEAILPVLPHDRLEIRLTFGEGDDDRTLALTPEGASWGPRLDRLRAALAPWSAA